MNARERAEYRLRSIGVLSSKDPASYSVELSDNERYVLLTEYSKTDPDNWTITTRIPVADIDRKYRALFRECRIVNAEIGETGNPPADGAYDLLDIEGNPNQLGESIGNCLSDADLYSAAEFSAVDSGKEVYIDLRIAIKQGKVPGK